MGLCLRIYIYEEDGLGWARIGAGNQPQDLPNFAGAVAGVAHMGGVSPAVDCGRGG